MKRLIVWAARLYPRHWRDRYGHEFEALLDDAKASGPRELFDVLKGATTMRLAQSPAPLIAIFTLAGMLAMIAVWAAIPNLYRSEGTFAVPQDTGLAAINEAAADALGNHQLQPLMHKYGVDSPDAVELSKKRITIRKATFAPSHPRDQVVGVHFDDSDPAKAQGIAKDLMELLVVSLQAKGVAANVVDAARPAGAIYPSWKPLPAIGLVGGLLCGLLAARIRKRTTPATPGAS